jgi:hypothetical protein
MAIHGPRNKGKKDPFNDSFYDTLTDEQKGYWINFCIPTILPGTDPMSLRFIQKHDEDTIRRTVNKLKKMLDKEVKELCDFDIG